MKQILKFEDFKGKTITEVFTGDGWEFEWAAFKFSDDTFGFIQSTSGYEDSGLAAPDIIGEPFSVHRSGINNLLVSLGVQTLDADSSKTRQSHK